MKKFIPFIPFFLFLLTTQLQAQGADDLWFGPDKSWQMTHNSFAFEGCETWTVNGSTNINGIDAKILRADGWRYHFNLFQLDTALSFTAAYGYSSGDSVFLYTTDNYSPFWASNGWYLAYDLSMQPGDTISYHYPANTGLSQLDLLLDSVAEITLDNTTRKWMHFEILTAGSTNPELLGDAAVIEGIGMTCISRVPEENTAFSYPCLEKSFPVENSWSSIDPRYAIIAYADLDPTEGIHNRSITCYQDAQININTQPDEEECCAIPAGYINGTNELPVGLQLFRLSPNPATAICTLEYSLAAVPGETQFLLLNAHGQTLGIFRPEALQGSWQIPVQHLPKGSYFIAWQHNGQIRYGKMLMKF